MTLEANSSSSAPVCLLDDFCDKTDPASFLAVGEAFLLANVLEASVDTFDEDTFVFFAIVHSLNKFHDSI